MNRGARTWFAIAGLALMLQCAPAEDPARGAGPSVVRMAVSQDPASLSLIGKTDLNTEIVAMRLTDALVQYDEQLELQPLLAESWEVDTAARTITFHLRENVRWHDGEPVTAADVLWTIGKVRAPETENRTWGPDLRSVVDVSAPDEYTVVATYSELNADALSGWRTPILPAHIAGKDADLFNGEFARHPIGCGPFKFVSYVRGQEIVLEANDDYWNGRPEIDRLEIKFFSDQQTAYQALLTGDLHILAMSSNLWKQLADSPDAERFVLTSYQRYAVWVLGWNQATPYFDDARVRRAMVHALDRRTFIDNVVDGMAHLGATTFPPSSNWADPTIEPLAYDPGEARRLLDEAGWVDRDGDGVRERGGVRFSISLLVAKGPQQLTEWMAAWQKEQWAEVGVETTIDRMEFQTMRERRKDRAFHVLGQSFHLTDPDMSALYHSSESEGGFNFWGLADPRIDALLDAVRNTLDPSTRRDAMFRLQRLLHEQQPVTALFFFDAPLAYDRRLAGVRTSPLGYANTIHGPRVWRWTGGASD